LYNAFNGSTDDVHKIFDSAQLLLESANANFDPTTQLLRQLVPVLATQEHTAPEIVSAYHDLASFTDQIAASDADIRGDLDKAPGFAHEFEALFNQLRPTLPILLNNINNVSKVTTTYLPQLQQTLVIAPVIVNQVSSIYLTNPIPNVLGFDFKLTANNPPVCTKGFVQVHRDPNDISAAAPPVDTYCKTPHDSPLSIRGNKNDPCPAGSRVPRANSAANCGFDFQAPSEAKRATDAGIETLIQAYNDSLKRPGKIIGTNECEGNDPPGSLSGRNSGEGKSTFPGPSGCEGGPPIPLPPPSGATTYSPDTGLGVTPGGQPFVNGNGLPRPAGADGLGSFLSGPLGTPIP
jgi:phospholipid/cholesterol/gamma-HCH transport system substrate-binding protein